jgi:dTDP-4-amino-4,6-dideoxygalactose transaminase
MMTSFYATKLICAGQGRLVASSDRALMKEVERSCCCDGIEDPRPAWNENLSDWAAILALPQVCGFDDLLSKRKTVAERYTQAFEPYSDRFELPRSDDGFGHSWYRYVIRLRESAEGWSGRLAELGVEAKRPVFRPLHRIFGIAGDFPVAEDCWRRSLSIPIYPTLSVEEQERVVDAVKEVAEKRGMESKG